MDSITARTGGAKLKRLGHTASSVFGRDSRVQRKGGRAVRDEK